MKNGLGGVGAAIFAFTLVAALVLGGLGWMTEAALRLEQDQGEVRGAVDLNNRLRIALWRLDGRISPVLAQESARPFEHFSAVYAPAAALDAQGAAWPAGAILEPSPLLDATLPPWMKLHFQFQSDGVLASPQTPPGALLARLREAEVASGNVTPERQAALTELQGMLDPARLASLLPPPKSDEPSTAIVDLVQARTAAGQQVGLTFDSIQTPPPGNTGSTPPSLGSNDHSFLLPPGDGTPSEGPGRQMEGSSAPSEPPAGGGPIQSLDPPGMLGGGSPGSRVANGMGGAGNIGAGGLGGNSLSGGPGQNDVGAANPPAEPEDVVQQRVIAPGGYMPPSPGYESTAGGYPSAPQGDYARRMAQRATVAKDVPSNSIRPAKGYAAYANDVAFDWLPAELAARTYGTLPDGPIEVGPLTPVWLPSKTTGAPDLLVAARLVKLGERIVCQGVLIDWPTLRDELGREIHDLFPAAELKPGRIATADALERTMTALPVLLDPSETPVVASVGWSPLRIGVAIAWTAALAALLSAFLGGWSLWELSQRRIRFVSAVTHELRTPLTTLRLYLDMLTSGLVQDEARQAEYLQTLNAESDRLNRLITNVLEFSRLEGRRSDVLPQEASIDALLEDVAADWELRCRDAGKTLVVENALAGRRLVVDERLAQQILGILVDNACKYSRGADDGRIWLRATSDGRGGATFEVEDRGPGVPPAERQRVFQPFWRGRSDEAAAGGVGLGLTLAQRWTSLLRGRLSVGPARESTGACFRLQLPGLVESPETPGAAAAAIG